MPRKARAAMRDSKYQVWRDGVSSGAMAEPATIPDVPRKRGNPNSGRPIPPAPVLATEFELQVRKLRLTSETYVFSAELCRWCEENRNRYYIPEWLLGAWHIAVDANVSDAG
jgi:hypothetical protein